MTKRESLPSHTLYNLDTRLAQSPLSIFYAGNYAVCIFLIISGFVLSRNYYIDNKRMNKIATNRYLRLCIPILVSTLIIYIFMKLSLFSSVEVAKVTGSQWLNDLYNFTPNFKEMLSITLFDVLFKGSSKYNTVFWMMSILFYGSFLIFLVMKLWGNMRNRQVIYVLLILVFLKLNNFYYITFILGIFCADISVNYRNIIDKMNNKIAIVTMIVIGIYLGCYPIGVVPTNIFYSWLNIGEKSFEIYHIIGAFMVVLGIMCSEKVQVILSKRVFQYLGRISFSIFLVHIIVLCSFSCSIFVKV
jgi:Predicted acyltransferases